MTKRCCAAGLALEQEQEKEKEHMHFQQHVRQHQMQLDRSAELSLFCRHLTSTMPLRLNILYALLHVIMFETIVLCQTSSTDVLPACFHLT